MRTYVIIPAGGSGKRCSEALPKQYVKVNGKEIIAHTVEVFQKSPMVDEIIIAAQPVYFSLINEISARYGFNKIKEIVQGGKERQDSVYNALSSIAADGNDIVAIHDAARPFLSQQILTEALSTASMNFDGVLVALKARDTLLKGEEFIDSYLERDGVYYAQTPQIFKYRILKEAMEKAAEENFYGTDESMLVRRAGYNVKLIEGSVLNFKITTKSDLEIFELISNSISAS